MTTVTSTVSTRRLHIENNLPNEATLMLEGDGGLIDVDRAEFLAAVANELDVIVINRSELPEVKDWEVELIAGGSGTAADARLSALRFLVVAEHLEAYPPVDEAQVNALVDLMEVSDDNGVPKHYADIARRLVAAGVRAPQAGDDQ